MKKILALSAIVAGINMMAGEAWAGGSVVLDDYKGGGMYCADDKSGCVDAIKKLLGMDQQDAERYLEDHWRGGLLDISDLDPGAQETLCSSRRCEWPSSDKPSGGSSSGSSSSSGGSSSGDSSSGGSSSGGSSSGSSSSDDSAVSGSRTKYDLNDAAAAINPDGQDNTVTIGF